MRHVADCVYGVPMYAGFLNLYVLDTGAGLAVVDTGISAGSIDRLDKALARRGRSLADVRHIFITHGHADHVGGLAALQARTNALTYAHRLEAPAIRGETTLRAADPADLRGVQRLIAARMARMEPAVYGRVDVEVEDGQSLDAVLPGLRVVHLPGHSDGQVGYYLADSRVLIGGDVMGRFPWGLGMPLRGPSPDWQAAEESVRKAAVMDVLVLCLGHGRPLVGSAAQPADQAIARLAQRVSA